MILLLLESKKMLEGQFPGKARTSFVLTWVADIEKVTEGGDLGYTYGVKPEITRQQEKYRKELNVTYGKKNRLTGRLEICSSFKKPGIIGKFEIKN